MKNDNIMIKVDSKEEIDRIRTSITEKCRKQLEAKAQELRNPRQVICNIPEDITLYNATQTIQEQNSELHQEESDITAKFINGTKRNTRNLVIELNSHTRKKIINIRTKIG
jgi:hypothetical protein